jgi:hypothetical protein
VQVERIQPIAAVFSKPVAESWTQAALPPESYDGDQELDPISGIKHREQLSPRPRKFVPPIPREEPDE